MYIGKTNNPKSRWNSHKRQSRIIDKNSFVVHKAINKYGLNNFEFKILESNKDELIILDREQFWIKEYKSNICKYGDRYGYNLTDGGEGACGHLHSEESKLKMSMASSGVPKSEEHKASLSEAHMGKILSPEHCKALSKAGRGKVRPDSAKEKDKENKTGSKNPQAKLNEEKVTEIKRLFINTDLSDTEIGKQYGVHRKTINDIRTGRMWTHILPNEIIPKQRRHNIDFLNEDKVIEIKLALHEDLQSTSKLAELYQVSETTIYDIQNSKTWKHIFPDMIFEKRKDPSKILNEESVKQIRELDSEGKTAKEMAKIFGVSKVTIMDVISGRTWKHVN